MERDQAVLIINLSPKPYLKLTDDDVRALLKFDPRITAIIFDNQADWFAVYDEAKAMQLAHENYEASLLGGGDAPPEVSPGVPATPVKAGWGFWK